MSHTKPIKGFSKRSSLNDLMHVPAWNAGVKCKRVWLNVEVTQRGCDFLHAVFVVPPLGGIGAE